MGKLFDFLDLFRKGAAVSEPALWKNRSAFTLALTALILTGCKVAKGYGYDIPIGEAEAASIAAGIAVVVGLFSTYATSDKVGLLPAKVQPDPIPDLSGTASPDATPVDRYEQPYPRDTGGGS